MDARFNLFICIIGACACEAFQYFIENNKLKRSKVIEAIESPTCLHLDERDNVTLRGGINSGKFTKRDNAKNMESCIYECCKDSRCDVAFRLGAICYGVDCYSELSCESIPTNSANSVGGVKISHINRDTSTDGDLLQNQEGHVDKLQNQEGLGDTLQNQEGHGDTLQNQEGHGDTLQNQDGHGDKIQDQNIVAKDIVPESTDNVCLFSRVAYNRTIIGGGELGQIVDLGELTDVRDCADQCCRHDNCKVALVRDNRCFAVKCFGKPYCESREAPSTDNNVNLLVYMNKINNERQPSEVPCNKKCTRGICTNPNTCLCDVGVTGKYCNEYEIKGKCDPGCGDQGKCTSYDTCLCENGWDGYKCDQLVCKAPCGNGICVNTGQCRCNLGWAGVYCNETNGDKAVLASTGEQVLFTEAEIEPELAIKVPAEAPPMHGSETVSAVTVAACCGVASMFLAIVAVVSMAKQSSVLKCGSRVNDTH